MSDADPNADAEPKYFAAHAGLVVFPRSPADLVSTTLCPACLSPLGSMVCTRCGLDLSNPVAAELATVSADAATALATRLELIGRIRYESERASRFAAARSEPAASAIVAPEEVAPAAVSAPILAPPLVAPPLVATAAPSLREPDAPTRVPRRSSVQILLLVVGVALLSIAAIFFLVYAFITYGIVVRSAIIGAITVASFIVATMLQRKKLRATAEGIAVFSALLLYLDAYAVRANDLFGAQSTDGLAYWGFTLVVSSVVLLAWNRVSGLRVPSIVGFAALAPGLGFAAGGFGTHLAWADRTYLITIVAALGALVHPIAALWASTARSPGRASAERMLILFTAIITLPTALVVAFLVAGKTQTGGVYALVGVGIVAAAHVVVASRAPALRVTTGLVIVLAVVGVIAVQLTGSAIAARNGDFASLLFWPPLVAAPVALVLEVLVRRSTMPFWRPVGAASSVAAAIVATIWLIAPALFALGNVLGATGVTSGAWSLTPLSAAGARDATVFESIGVIAIVGAFAAALWAVLRLGRWMIVAWFATTVLIAAAPLLITRAAVVGGWLAIGILAFVAIAVLRRRFAFPFGAVAPLVVLGALSSVLGYATSWSSEQLWYFGTVGAILTLVLARATITRDVARATLVGATAIVAVVGAAALARQLTPAPLSPDAKTFDSLAAVAVVASTITVLSLVLPRVAVLERRVLFWIAFPTAVAASAATWVSGQQATELALPRAQWPLEPSATTTAVGIVLLVAIACAILMRRTTLGLRPERLSAAVVIAPVVLLALDSTLHLVPATPFVTGLEPAIAAVLVAVAGLIIVLLAPGADSALRTAMDVGVATIGGGSLLALAAGAAPTGSVWLAVVIFAAVALVSSISQDGVFGSRSPRRFLGWGALALATFGLWTRLGEGRVDAVEPYVLPVAGALLAIAALLDRSARTRDPQPRAAPLVALGALLVGVVPVAVTASSGTPVRATLIGAFSVIAVAVGVDVAPRSAAHRDYLAVLAFVGTLGALVLGIGRSAADRSSGQLTSDLWFVGAIVVITAASFLMARQRDRGASLPPRVRSIAAQLTFAVALLSVFAVENPLLAGNSATAAPYGRARDILVVVLFGLVYVASTSERPPATRAVGILGLGLAAVMVVESLSTDPAAVGGRVFTPIELGAAPIGLALVVAGALRMSRSASTRSWAQLGPGLVVLLGPSLLATLLSTEERPLWRLVGLGVAAIALVVSGVGLKLQAPFILGTIVVLVHGIATFAAQIRVVYESVPWWLWLGVGGVLIILLAARYEHRIRNLRSVALRISSLR